MIEIKYIRGDPNKGEPLIRPIIIWTSKWAREIWEKKYGPTEESKRRQIERDKKEDLERKEAIKKHAKTKDPAIERERRLINERKRIAAADPRSHDALNANRLGKTHGREKDDGFYVPGTREFQDLNIVYGFLENDKSVRINGQSYLMVCKTKISKHARFNAVSMCNQSLQYYLKKTNELVTQNVTMRHLATSQAILVAVVYDGETRNGDKYKLQSIYQANDAVTLGLAGALDNLISNSQVEVFNEDGVYFEDEDFVSSVDLPSNNSPLENVVYLLANKDILRQQIRAITGGEPVEDTYESYDTYDSGMPFFIDKEYFALFKYLQTNQGTIELERWIDSNPTQMSINDYKEWLFKPAGQDVLERFWEFLSDETTKEVFSYLDEPDIKDNSYLNEPVIKNEPVVKNETVIKKETVVKKEPVIKNELYSDKTRLGGADFLESYEEYNFPRISPTTVVEFNFDDIPDSMCERYIKPNTKKNKKKKY